MSQTLRQRTVTKPAGTLDDNDHLSGPGSSRGLNLDSMQAASPQHTGSVMKLHVPLFYTILPRSLQQILIRAASKYSFLSCLHAAVPEWKHRYLVLLGSFVYKFTENGSHPKGSPVLVENLDIQMVARDESELSALDFDVEFPEGYTCLFSVSNLRKKYYFACTGVDEATAWLNSLHEARQEAIKRSMGHAPKDSYPARWDYFDSLGRSLMNSKDRVRKKMELNNLQEMEMSGAMPRGYYG